MHDDREEIEPIIQRLSVWVPPQQTEAVHRGRAQESADRDERVCVETVLGMIRIVSAAVSSK